MRVRKLRALLIDTALILGLTAGGYVGAVQFFGYNAPVI